LGVGFAIVTSLDGYDEVSLTGEYKVATNHYESILKPEDVGLTTARQEELFGGKTPEEACAIFDHVLEGTATEAQKNAVLINAAYAIQTVEAAKSIEDCLAIARESLESGKALATFKKFLTLNA
jgi:anthranilate phosphoribosyltransferase